MDENHKRASSSPPFLCPSSRLHVRALLFYEALVPFWVNDGMPRLLGRHIPPRIDTVQARQPDQPPYTRVCSNRAADIAGKRICTCDGIEQPNTNRPCGLSGVRLDSRRGHPPLAKPWRLGWLDRCASAQSSRQPVSSGINNDRAWLNVPHWSH